MQFAALFLFGVCVAKTIALPTYSNDYDQSLEDPLDKCINHVLRGAISYVQAIRTNGDLLWKRR